MYYAIYETNAQVSCTPEQLRTLLRISIQITKINSPSNLGVGMR